MFWGWYYRKGTALHQLHWYYCLLLIVDTICKGSANERRRYHVTPSLIGQTHNAEWFRAHDPVSCNMICLAVNISKQANSRIFPELIFMPPPLGAGGIMFSGCPSVRPSVRLSVRPSVRPKPEIPSFDLHMGPLVHPTNRNRFTACPSVRPSVRLSVRPSVRPSVRRGFRAFAGERMEGMAWNFTCWCILTVFRTN